MSDIRDGRARQRDIARWWSARLPPGLAYQQAQWERAERVRRARDAGAKWAEIARGIGVSSALCAVLYQRACWGLRAPVQLYFERYHLDAQTLAHPPAMPPPSYSHWGMCT